MSLPVLQVRGQRASFSGASFRERSEELRTGGSVRGRMQLRTGQKEGEVTVEGEERPEWP